MITSLVVKQHFQNLQSLLSYFPILTTVKYVPSLTFDPDLRKHVVLEDVSFKRASGMAEWIGILWSREALQVSDVQGRRFDTVRKVITNPAAPVGTVHGSRFTSLPLTLAFVGTSLHTITILEEFILTHEFRTSFEVDCGEVVGTIDVSVTNSEISGLNKEDHATYGSIAVLTVTQTLQYPVVWTPGSDVKLIATVDDNIYEYDYELQIGGFD